MQKKGWTSSTLFFCISVRKSIIFPFVNISFLHSGFANDRPDIPRAIYFETHAER